MPKTLGNRRLGGWVQGSGVWGFGFRGLGVSGSGLQGCRFRASGFIGFRASGFRVQGSGFWVKGTPQVLNWRSAGPFTPNLLQDPSGSVPNFRISMQGPQ